MAQNTTPIFSLTPNVSGSVVGSAALTRSDGNATIGTDIFKIFTAGPDGSFVQRVRFVPVSTTAATSTTATVLRVYVSTQTTGATTDANTWCVQEMSAAAQVAASATVGATSVEVPLNFVLPAGYTLLASSHAVNATNTRWMATAFGGNY